MDLIKDRKEFITQRGFRNLSEFARACGENASNVHKVIKGQQKPSIEKLLKYAAALDCDVIQLIYLFYYEETIAYIKARNERR